MFSPETNEGFLGDWHFIFILFPVADVRAPAIWREETKRVGGMYGEDEGKKEVICA